MQLPLVSFCFTTFKRHDHLLQTLHSVKAQSYTNFEVIVSDNDPAGSGRSVVEGMQDSRFKYFANGENLGMKKSFNKSLERSTGEYVVMIADDDPVYPDMLQTLIELVDKYPGFGMYLGGSNWFCTDPTIAKLYGVKVGTNSQLADLPIDTIRTYSGNEFLLNFYNHVIFPYFLWSTGFIKRDIIVEKGGIPDYNTPFLGDYAYLAIMGSHSGCVTINRALGHQTIHVQNFGRNQNDQLVTAVVNYIDYVTPRINHVKDWPVVEKGMKNFVALWALTHLAFLKNYFAKNKHEDDGNLAKYEKEVFNLPVMRPYRLKYWLKLNMPVLHNYIVKQKKHFKKTA